MYHHGVFMRRGVVNKLRRNPEEKYRLEDLMKDADVRKQLLRFEVTDAIDDIMDSKGINKTSLAKTMGTSLANVSQILNGHRNFTIDTLTEIALALDMGVQIKFVDLCEKESKNEEGMSLRFSMSLESCPESQQV